jgi:nucleoredoxin
MRYLAEETTDDINTHKCLIVFQEGVDMDVQIEVENAVRMSAEEYRGDELIKFYWANDATSALSGNIREACRLGEVTDVPTMILLDVKNDGTFYVSKDRNITTATIKLFLLNYSNDGNRQQICG